MNKIEISAFKTRFGELSIASYNNKLCLCDWQYRKMRSRIDQRIKNALKAEYFECESEIIRETKMQLTEYFEGQRKIFDIPLLLIGTDFQISVWEKLLQIPYGKTSTYTELSQQTGKADAVRAVAAANAANAISVIIPCHRIIGSDGAMLGYAGGVDVKLKLLSLESDKSFNQLELF